jgi:uncharacterized membrane protein YeaQ/YmgE (transglycosylase-associated protein family)
MIWVRGKRSHGAGSIREVLVGWLFVLVMGVIIGLLGKFVAPGDKDNIPLWLTVICGIGGVVIGYGLFGDTGGIDWIAFFISIVLAAVFVVIAATVTGRTKKA